MAPKSRPPTSVRGRNSASKPLTASTISSSAKTTVRQSDKQPMTAKVQSVPPARAGGPSKPAASRPIARSESRLKVSSSKPVPVSKPETPDPSKTANAAPKEIKSKEEPSTAPDPLQLAAQAYPWMYMTSTLEACFSSSEATALKILEEREQQVEQAEGEVHEQIVRTEAERAIEFYAELDSDKFAKAAPAIMTTFHSHGDACARAEVEALELASRGMPDPEQDSPLKEYYDMLDNLDQLHADAVELESLILELTSGEEETREDEIPSARSRILGIISACLPVVRARIMNISMAQQLVESAQENASISLRMESLGLD